MEIDWQGVAAAVTAICLGVGGWWMNRGKKAAAIKAEIATSEAQADSAAAHGAVADAQQAVYRLMMDRLTTLEADMRAVREELNVERKHSRKLELHIFRLESLMRAANIPVPELEDRP